MTDGRTDEQTERQNYDPQDRASIAASRGNQSINTTYVLTGISVLRTTAPRRMAYAVGMSLGVSSSALRISTKVESLVSVNLRPLLMNAPAAK